MPYSRLLKPIFFFATVDAAAAAGAYLFDDWGWQYGGSGFVGLICLLVGMIIGVTQTAAFFIICNREDTL